MHILGHNPAVWAIVRVGLQGDFFDGKEPNREANAEELKMLQYNAQARYHLQRIVPRRIQQNQPF